MKTFLKYVVGLSVFFLVSALMVQGAEAAYLKFDQSSVSVNAGQTFTIGVVVDAGTDQVQSSDIYVTYDSTALEAQSVTPGTYFPSVLNTISPGRVYIAGVPQQQNQPKTGSGTVATITFMATKPATLSFDCTSSTIIQYDPNSPNIIQCSQNQTASVIVGGVAPPATGTSDNTAGTGGTAEPTPSVLPQAGFFDNTLKIAIPGLMLLTLGLMARVIL